MSLNAKETLFITMLILVADMGLNGRVKRVIEDYMALHSKIWNLYFWYWVLDLVASKLK